MDYPSVGAAADQPVDPGKLALWIRTGAVGEVLASLSVKEKKALEYMLQVTNRLRAERTSDTLNEAA